MRATSSVGVSQSGGVCPPRHETDLVPCLLCLASLALFRQHTTAALAGCHAPVPDFEDINFASTNLAAVYPLPPQRYSVCFLQNPQ